VSDLPAILGGRPVRPQGPPEWPGFDPDVAAAVEHALADGSWGRYEGPHVERLENELAQFHHVPFALTCASGTLAVEIALRALGIGPGDEVILAAYDYEANFLCVIAVGAVPVLVDVSPNNWNIDANLIEAAVTSKTRAILVSHLHGGLVPMSHVRAIADRHSLRVVVDAAQATGAVVEMQPAGSWGDIGILSFGGSKLLSAGRGGALLTRYADVRQKLRLLLRRGYQQWAALSELQAAALLPQIAKLKERNSIRHINDEKLRQLLADVPGWRFFETPLADSLPVFYKLGVQFDPKAFGVSRERFLQAIRAEGVAFDAGFRAFHMGRSPDRYRAGSDLHEAERAHNCALVLHHPILLGCPADIEEVAVAVRKLYANADRLSRQE
jgi:dTDP-4-amino-4,6-dideoxygalactose transaminase